MAINYKILGQSAPTSTANADLYTCPASTQTIVSTLVITNVTTSIATARVFIRSNGATAAASNAIVYDSIIYPNTTATFTIGATLDASDVVTVQTGTSNALTFTAFGSEIV